MKFVNILTNYFSINLILLFGKSRPDFTDALLYHLCIQPISAIAAIIIHNRIYYCTIKYETL